jgi:hypothetical protein
LNPGDWVAPLEKEVLELIKLNSDTDTVGGLNELSVVDATQVRGRKVGNLR